MCIHVENLKKTDYFFGCNNILEVNFFVAWIGSVLTGDERGEYVRRIKIEFLFVRCTKSCCSTDFSSVGCATAGDSGCIIGGRRTSRAFTDRDLKIGLGGTFWITIVLRRLTVCKSFMSKMLSKAKMRSISIVGRLNRSRISLACSLRVTESKQKSI